MKVLMIGATGTYAAMVLPELKRRSVFVRALVRDDAKAADAQQKGADEAVLGDLTDLPSLRAAAEGMDGVFHINPVFVPHEADLGVAMVEAAKDAGVRKFVFSSVIHPSLSKMVNHAGKRPVEEALYESGMDFTVLQPAMFMQTLGGGWEAVLKTGHFALPYSAEVKVCFVDYRDVAEVAALAFTEDRLAYGTFELCALGMVNRAEIAALMSEALGRTIRAVEVPFDDWAQATHLPPGLVWDGLKIMDAEYDQHGFPGGNALVLRAVLGREPRTLRQYLQELAAG